MPYRLREVNRVARGMGLNVAQSNATSHWKYSRPGHRCGVITAHNGEREEIPDQYIRNMCRTTGLDVTEFFARLRNGT